MVVRFNDRDPVVKDLQRGLNKLGAMLLVDGQYGGGTRQAVSAAREALGIPGSADEVEEGLQTVLAALPDQFPPLTAAGVTFIGRCEVTNADLYRKQHHIPHWPGPKSGITIGIGYDLQFVDAGQFRADWTDRLPAAVLARLERVIGNVGSAARVAELTDISVPLFAATAVFCGRSLPHYYDMTRKAFPGLNDLPSACRTALVSLVYNRGASFKDRDPVRQERREMRAIRDCMAAGNLDEVPVQLEAMTRLWDPAEAGGLIRRRRDEASLWRSGFPALTLD